MAKLSKLVSTKPIALEVDGVYVRNLPAKQVDEQFGNIQEQLETDPEAVIARLFKDLICDEDGVAFEDCDSFEAITAILPMNTIHSILNAVPKALMPSESNVKK